MNQLLKHYLETGQFDATSKRATSYSAGLNGQGNDRVIETTAAAVLALISRREYLNDSIMYEKIISTAISYLKTQVKGGLIGGNLATLLTMRAF